MAELDPVVVEAFVEAHGALSAILKNVGQPGDREYIALHRQHAARRALQKIWKAQIREDEGGGEARDTPRASCTFRGGVMKKYRIGKETFTIEKIHDEYLVTVRDQNDEPFVGADESLYELRIVIRPGYNTDMCLVAFEGSEEICDIFRDDKYINIAEALAAGWDLISEMEVK